MLFDHEKALKTLVLLHKFVYSLGTIYVPFPGYTYALPFPVLQ